MTGVYFSYFFFAFRKGTGSCPQWRGVRYNDRVVRRARVDCRPKSLNNLSFDVLNLLMNICFELN